MRLGGKMADGIDPILSKDDLQCGRIADIRFFEDVPPRICLRDPVEIFGFPA
jgi:hypothetical protein